MHMAKLLKTLVFFEVRSLPTRFLHAFEHLPEGKFDERKGGKTRTFGSGFSVIFLGAFLHAFGAISMKNRARHTCF